jgi:hypothetical protein
VEETLVNGKNISLVSDTELGNITDIFQQYYQSILDKLTNSEKIQTQKLIEDELIEGNRRNPLSLTYIKAKFGITENLLNQLEQSSLLRKERDASGRILYEVSHDTLVTAIEKVAQGRRKTEENLKKIELEKQILEERKRAEVLEVLNKKAIFRYKLAIGLVVFSLLIATVAFYFYRESDKAALNAIEQEKIAKKNASIAEDQKNKAKKAYDELKKGNDLAIINEKNNSGIQFKQNGNNGRACDMFRVADSILSIYPEEKQLIKEIKQNILESCRK